MGRKKSGPNSILEWALRYHNAGINVIKAHYGGKCPPKGGELQAYLTRRVTEAEIYEWFGPGSSHCNISGVTGPVSGGLTVLDFDSAEAYECWKRRFPELADRLPTVQSYQGYHVFFRSKLEKDDTTSFHKMDIKAGTLISLPPSMHKNKTRYRWLIPFPEHVSQLPLLDPYKWGLEDFPDGNDGTEGTDEGSDGNEGEVSGVGVVRLESLPTRIQERIMDIIVRTLPSQYGQRYMKLFLLARCLKGVDEISKRSGEELMAILKTWHEKALPNIEHKSFNLTRLRFLNAWEDAKYPPGQGESLKIAWANAQKSKHLIPELKQYEGDDTMERLIRLCFELQKLAGPDGEWFLPTNKGQELFGISHSWLATLLKGLESDKIIRKTKQHTKLKCSRYVFTGPSAKMLKKESA